MMAATFSWAVFLEGYLNGPIGWAERLAHCAASLAVIFAPTGTLWWGVGCVAIALLVGWAMLLRVRFAHG
jgi:hypothetical protein